MSQLNSEIPTNQTKRPPLTQAQLDWMARTPCKHGENCERHKQGNCFFLHGGGAVAFDPWSPRRVPHAQQTPPPPRLLTENDILARICELPNLGELSKLILELSSSVEIINKLFSAIEMFRQILSSFETVGHEDLRRIVNEAFSYLNEVKTLLPVFEKFKMVILNSNYSTDIRKKSIDMFLRKIQLPEGVDEILREFDALQRKSLDPVAQARENLDGIPTPEFLEHLTNPCGLHNNAGFKEMRQSHETLGHCSPYTNKSFLGLLDVHRANEDAKTLLEAHRLKKIKDHQIAEARARLLQQCLTRKNPNLNVSFRVLQAQSEFTSFVQSLSEEDRQTLVSVFGSFMTYIAHISDNKETEITSEFLKRTFISFTQSRKVDGKTTIFKEKFYELVMTDLFRKVFEILHVETSSLHRSYDGLPETRMKVHEILKFMMKELLDLYEDKVPHHELDNFRKGLVRELLPLAFLISLSPKMSNMLSGRWKKGEVDRTTGQPVNHYLKMQDTSEKKSVLYWLLMNLNDKVSLKKKQKSETCDTFEKLSSQFTCEREITISDGSIEKKKIFSPDLLFQALQHVQIQNFLNSSEFPIKLQNIEQDWLGTLFCVKGDMISLSDTCPDELLIALYYALGSSERDPHTRQFSDLKALIHKRPEVVIRVVELCRSFNSENQTESVLAIIESLGFKGVESLESPLITLLTLITDNGSNDLLRKAYDIMSLAMSMIDIHNRNDCYFMSLVDALVVVLLIDKFPSLRQFDIMQAVYKVKSKPERIFSMRSDWIRAYIESLSEQDMRNGRLTTLISEEKVFNRTESQEMNIIVSSLRNILSIHGLRDGSFHDEIKRILPFFLDKNSYVGLLKTDSDFEIVSSEGSHQESSACMLDKIRALFEKEISMFIASQNSKIQWDLKNRMEEIKQILAVSDRLKAFAFTKHASAIANLVNALLSTLALPLQLNAEEFTANFPRTMGLEQSTSAKLVCDHVLSMIGVVKPVEPKAPETGPKKKSKSKSKSKSKAIADCDASVKKFTLEMEKFQMLEDIVSRAISEIYRVELPKEEGATFKKAPKIKLSELKDILLQSTTLVDLFGRCLTYSKFPLVRELILSILDHKFKHGDESVRDLYRQIQNFGVLFESSESSEYPELFLFLNNPADTLLSQIDSEDTGNFFEQIKDTLSSDFWNDESTEVEIKSPVVQQRGAIVVRRRQPKNNDDSEISLGGGGPAPAPELEVVEVVEESVQVVGFDIIVLRILLSTTSKDDVIAYMESFSSRDDEEEAILQLLKEDSSTCQSVLKAVNEVFN